MFDIGKPNHAHIIIPAPGADALAAYLTADHVSACAPAVVSTALFLTRNGAYENVEVLADPEYIISFGYSITNLHVFDGCTVHAAYIVNTAAVPAVCDAIICLCPTAVGLVTSSTIRIWKFLNWFASGPPATHAVVDTFGIAVPAIVVAVTADAVILHTNPVYVSILFGLYCSSSTDI